MAAAIASGTITAALGLNWNQCSSGTAGRQAVADDTVGGVVAIYVLRIQGAIEATSIDDELVPGRQHVALADVELKAIPL